MKKERNYDTIDMNKSLNFNQGRIKTFRFSNTWFYFYSHVFFEKPSPHAKIFETFTCLMILPAGYFRKDQYREWSPLNRPRRSAAERKGYYHS